MSSARRPPSVSVSVVAPAPGSVEAAAALADLVRAIAAERDRAAFVQVFEHFAPRVKGYLMRLGVDASVAEELMQDVMLTVWRRADTFDPRLASVGTWLFTIARNKRIDALRRGRRPEWSPDDPALTPDPVDGADVAYDLVQSGARLRAAVDNLSDDQSKLLLMAYYQDKSHSEIAAETGVPLGTVKSRIRLALARLRDAMKDS
jgi:RNA polymerase sigma factor (sigma-70 family)